jgi:hypothetical protein
VARRAVVEIRCARCQRVEYRVSDTPVRSFLGILREGDLDEQSVSVEFEELCEPCCKTILGYLEQIGKLLKGCSPERKAKGDEPTGEAGPSTPPLMVVKPPDSLSAGGPVGKTSTGPPRS